MPIYSEVAGFHDRGFWVSLMYATLCYVKRNLHVVGCAKLKTGLHRREQVIPQH